MNLIGVTVVVLAIGFLSIVFSGEPADMLEYGAGIALAIAALALFVGLRAWSTRGEQSDPESAEEATPAPDVQEE